MSKMAAVDTAVRLQMASDGKTPVFADKMTDIGYKTSNAIEKFFLGVAIRLKLDTPSLVFDWSSLDSTKAVDQTLEILQNLIDARTKVPTEPRARSAESS